MKIHAQINGKRYRARLPFDGAEYVIVDTECPECGDCSAIVDTDLGPPSVLALARNAAGIKEALADWSDVPTTSLIPGFVVSELKVAFWIGFRLFLPFVIIDMLIGSTLISLGMFMVPPPLVSLPFKLLLFVLADGWHLVVGMLLQSFT